MQMICGMHRSAYWLANFCVDLLKIEITVVCTIICFYLFNLKYHTAWITYLVFPFAAIPWTYTLSFVFSTESAAQTATLFINFGFILFGSTLIFYLRWVPSAEVVADVLHSVMKATPAYTLGQSIHFDANQAGLVEFRKNTFIGSGWALSNEPWIMANVLGDIVSLAIHFVFWSICVLVIEMGLAKKIN